MGRFNQLINSVGGPNNVSQGIVGLLKGQQALGGPRSALVQVMHSHVAQVTRAFCVLAIYFAQVIQYIPCLVIHIIQILKHSLDLFVSTIRRQYEACTTYSKQ